MAKTFSLKKVKYFWKLFFIVLKLFSETKLQSIADNNYDDDDNNEKGQIIAKFAVPPSSVTRLGNFLHFGQLFKAFGNN